MQNIISKPFNKMSFVKILVAAFTLSSFFIFNSGIALAADTGVKYPGTVTTNSDSPYSNENWSSAGNVSADDGSYASITTSSFDNNDYSYVLRTTNFGFNIPTDNTIKGIKVEIERYAGAGSARDALVQLTKNGTARMGSNKADTSNNWPGSVTVKIYGGETDLWGTTWTRDEINASTFGVHLAARAYSNDTDIYADFIRVTVYYAPTVTYTINASAGSGGTITPSGAVSVNENASQSFTVTPNTNNIISDVLVDAGSVDRLNSYTFTNVTADHTIDASFDGGWNAPGGASDSDNDVDNEGNTFSSNNSYATFNSSNDEADYTNFSLSIPSGSTINGIQVALEGNRDATSTRNYSVFLSWNNGGGVTTSQTASGWTTSDKTVLVGGTSDKWGRSWVPSDFNNGSFIVRVQSTTGGDDIRLDQIQVRVDYTVDTTAPVLSEVTPVPNPTNDNTPDYTFNSTEAGTITYGGDCSSITTIAVSGDNTITFNALADGEHSNCTIQVTDADSNPSSDLNVSAFTVSTAPTTGSLTVIKNTIGGDGTFDFSGDGGIGSFQITSASNTGSQTLNNLTPGSYTITETVPSDWAKTDDTCTAVTVSAGETATCTITNSKLPTLTVTKVVLNHSGGTKQVSDFPLFINDTPVTSGVPTTVVIGQNIVTETGSADYTATFSGDCDSSGNVTLAAGENKSCTLTNEYIYGENLIKNPSLELGTAGSPLYWSEGGWGNNTASYTYPVEGTGGPNSKAAKVEITSYTDGDAKWVFDNVTVTPGKYYVFSDKYMSTIGSHVVVEYHPTGGGNVHEEIGTLGPSGSWQTFSAGFNVPTNVTSLTIFHLINGVGVLTVDDYSLIQTTNPDAFSRGMVSLNFDDGWQSSYENGIPILNAANFKSTQYIITDTVLQQQGGYVSVAEVLDMQSHGHDIASHSKTHPDEMSGLVGFLPANLQSEVFGSRYDLLSTIGVKPTDSLAYPYGRYDDVVKAAIRGAGYLGARTVDTGLNTKATDHYLLKVQVVERDTTLAQVKDWVDTAALSNTWLILVFHQIDNDPANIYGTTPAMLQDIVNYLETSDVSVVTVSQGLHQMPGVPAAGDTIAPNIAFHADVTVEATSPSGAVVDYTVPAVTDNVDTGLVAACSPISGSTFAIGETLVTCNTADTSGNLATPVTFMVTVQSAAQTITFDTLADKVYGDPDFDVSATASSGLPVNFTASNDYCTISGNTVHITGAGSCTITAHQAGDLNYSPAPDVSQTFNINKATPVITWTNPADITYPAPLSNTELNATANVDGTFTYTPTAGTILNVGNGQTLHVDFAPTDATNYNSTSKNVSINVKGAATVILNNLSQTYDGSPKSVTADTVPVGLTVNFTYDGSATPPTNAGNYAVTGTIDDLNYTGSASDILVIDKAVLTITAQTNTKVYDGNVSAATTPTTISGLQGSDTVTGLVEVYDNKNVGTGKTLSVSAYTINDGNGGNNYTVTTVDDTTGVITTADLTVSAIGHDKVYDGNTNATVDFPNNVISGDEVTVSGSASFEDSNIGSDKAVHVTGISISGTDAVNYNLTNTTSDTTANITVRPITVTADNKTKSYGASDPELTYTITSGSLADGDSLTGSLTRDEGETLGVYNITQGTLAASTNYDLNFIPGTLTIGDTTGPVFDPTPDITEEASSPAGNDVLFNVTANDDFDGPVTPVCTPPSGSLFAIGTTPVNCIATDSNSNASNVSFNVNVMDTTKPIITLNGEAAINLVVGNTYTESGAIATDNIDGDITSNIVVGGDTVDTSVPGVYYVTYNVSDNAGNPADQVTRTVTVSDVSAPQINPISDISVEATSPGGAVVTYDSVTAIDDIDGIIPAVCFPESGATFPLGSTPVTCTATDSSSNVGYGTGLTITVTDHTPPTIDPHDNVIAEATSDAGAVVSYTPPMSHDIVDGDIPAECVPASNSIFPLGDTTVTCNKTDASENAAAAITFTITVSEMLAPVISDQTSSNSTNTSLTITWSTDTDHPATSRVIYDTTSHPDPLVDPAPNYGYANSTVENPTLVTNHSVVVSGLSSGTTYYLRTVSHGSPVAVSDEFTAQTTTPSPPAPTGGGYVPPSKKPGDIDSDGDIDVLDFNLLMINWGSIAANNIADLNTDGKVDILEFNLLMVNWGK